MTILKKYEVRPNALTKRVLFALSRKAWADDGSEEGDDPAPEETPTGVDINAIINQARSAEKKKLYSQIENLKKELKLAQATLNDTLVKAAELRQEYNTLKATVDSKEKSPELIEAESTIEKLKGKIAELEKDKPDEKAIREKIEAEYKVKAHLDKVKTDNKDKVLDVFLGDIQGDTIEAIDASVQSAIEKSNSVKAQLGISDEGKPESDPSNKKKAKPSKPPVAPPTANPSGANIDPKYTREYIASLDVNSPEFKQFRKEVLGL